MRTAAFQVPGSGHREQVHCLSASFREGCHRGSLWKSLRWAQNCVNSTIPRKRRESDAGCKSKMEFRLNGAPGEIRTPGLLIRSRKNAISGTVVDQQTSTAFKTKHLRIEISSAVNFIELCGTFGDKIRYSSVPVSNENGAPNGLRQNRYRTSGIRHSREPVRCAIPPESLEFPSTGITR